MPRMVRCVKSMRAKRNGMDDEKLEAAKNGAEFVENGSENGAKRKMHNAQSEYQDCALCIVHCELLNWLGAIVPEAI